MNKDFFERFFCSEYFDDFVDSLVEEVNKYEKENKKEETDDDEKLETYFHKIGDSYLNGHKTSHIEKEIKNGEVIKDVNEQYKLEDKNEKEEEEMSSDKALMEAKKLLDEARSTISLQMKEIDRSKKRCEELEDELNKFKNGIRALL